MRSEHTLGFLVKFEIYLNLISIKFQISCERPWQRLLFQVLQMSKKSF